MLADPTAENIFIAIYFLADVMRRVTEVTQ